MPVSNFVVPFSLYFCLILSLSSLNQPVFLLKLATIPTEVFSNNAVMHNSFESTGIILSNLKKARYYRDSVQLFRITPSFRLRSVSKSKKKSLHLKNDVIFTKFFNI